MVPSWTETLVNAGIEVVGRTRYCIHPADQVKSIPVVGGTKDWDWDTIRAINPDLILLDQEENPRFMAEQAQFPHLATHVTGIETIVTELLKIEQRIPSIGLQRIADEWRRVKPYRGELPGVIKWGRRPDQTPTKVYYVIWKDPWMVVSRDTFIGSMLSHCGIELPKMVEKYPTIDLAQIEDKERTLLLFSSEPFPFLRFPDVPASLGCPYAQVDGEVFSWFGVRSLRFLQSLESSSLT